MTTFEGFPAEIQQRIIKYISKKDLVQYQITSRQWYNNSAAALYNEIVIDQDKGLNRLIQAIRGNFSALLINFMKLVSFD